MNRVAGSRRHLAGLLRRRPILDPVVAGPSGAAGRSEDEVGTILERVDMDPADPTTEDDTTEHVATEIDTNENDTNENDTNENEVGPSSAPRQQPHMTS
jgi:hypothetical protein